MMFNVVWVASKNRITPDMPGGIASKMMKGSTKEANCAMRIRKTRTIDRMSPMANDLNDSFMLLTEPRTVNTVPCGGLASFTIF